MSAFEIIDNLDNLDYKFDKEKYIGYEYDDYDIINNKYSEIEDQIFKPLSFKESYVNNRYNYKLAFQKKNKDVLEYIIKKYNINKEFVDEFYNEFIDAAEKFNTCYDYVYLIIKNSFGDLLINKYTMAEFTISTEIVENILKANFKWYNSVISGAGGLRNVECFDIFKHSPSKLSEIIDFIFIRHLNWHRYFRKYYIFRRIEEMCDFEFEDQTQEKDFVMDYDRQGHLQNTFSEYCDENCLPWTWYNNYVDLDEDKTKKGFIDDDYLEFYKSVKNLFDNPIYYECNIIDIGLQNEESDNEDDD